MTAAIPFRSLRFTSAILCSVLAAVGCRHLYAQAVSPAAPAPAAAPVSSAIPDIPDPTKRETQPDLTADRDPILSPDIRDNAPVTAQKIPEGPVPAKGQELSKEQNGVYTLHENVDEVLLYCTVIDDKGRVIHDLDRSAFHIWEDNAPQNITSFRRQDLPVSMGIIVDNSGSMRDKRDAVKTAALNLVRASNPQDSTFIVNFANEAFLDQDFTSDLSALERGLSRGTSRGETAMYDAVAASADELAHEATRPKQVLLIITDGKDNASRLTLQQAVRRVQNLGGPVVYTMGLLFSEDNKQKALQAHSDLESLSAETGGVAYFPNSLDDVNGMAQQVAYDVRNQYTIGYHSTRAPNLGGYRVIHVEASAPGHGRLTVRTRRGYYAEALKNINQASRTIQK